MNNSLLRTALWSLVAVFALTFCTYVVMRLRVSYRNQETIAQLDAELDALKSQQAADAAEFRFRLNLHDSIIYGDIKPELDKRPSTKAAVPPSWWYNFQDQVNTRMRDYELRLQKQEAK